VRPSQATKLIRSSLAKAQRAAGKRRRVCLFPDCKLEAIASHSQQKERELRAIAEDGHVYALRVDLASMFGNTTPDVLSRQGISRATTFPGFCPDHDRRLFHSIDSGELEPTELCAASYALRALVHELRRKQFAFEMLCMSVPEIGDALGRDAVEPLIQLLEGKKAALENEIPFYTDQFGLVATGAEKNKVSFRWLRIDQALGVSCTTTVSLLFKQYETRRIAENVDPKYPVMTFSIVPEAQQTHIIAAWLQADEAHAAYARSELENTSDLSRLAVFLNRMAFAESENTTIRPSLWEGLGSQQQQLVVRSLREVAFRSHIADAEIPQVLKFAVPTNAVQLTGFP
jgi:hypothetical protein